MVLKFSEHWVIFRTISERPVKPLTGKKRLKNSRPVDDLQLTLYKPKDRQLHHCCHKTNTLVTRHCEDYNREDVPCHIFLCYRQGHSQISEICLLKDRMQCA